MPSSLLPQILVKLALCFEPGVPFLAPFAKSNANAKTILLNAGQELHMKIPNPAATTANKPPAVSTRSALAAPVDVPLAAVPVAVLLPPAKPLAALDSTAVELATLLPLLVLLATMSVVVPYACAASQFCVFSCWTPNKPGSLGQLL
jgi:hypothetical protein